MHLSWFMMVTALGEAATGLFLLVLPAGALASLLGVKEAGHEAIFLGRIPGSALLAIGVACWLARRDQGGPAQYGMLAGVLVYDVAAAALLAYAGLVLKITGLFLWPAVVLHSALAVWCMCVSGVRADPPGLWPMRRSSEG
jgi:hypothetical protein